MATKKIKDVERTFNNRIGLSISSFEDALRAFPEKVTSRNTLAYIVERTLQRNGVSLDIPIFTVRSAYQKFCQGDIDKKNMFNEGLHHYLEAAIRIDSTLEELESKDVSKIVFDFSDMESLDPII